ncbi:hypothetical protein [Burkholderia territorii]|uniref:hypothetical protein n=1 Tax=Burkholderia territorii TaxID=1503055 RepID=UPI00075E0BB5|nr:hypothetical protein [Burkholderia territorii]
MLPHVAVLDGLRHACHRRVVRHRHGAVFDALAQMGFITWVRQPTRLSSPIVSDRAIAYHGPVEIAELTPVGRSALDWLTGLERRVRWAILRDLHYGLRRAPDAP